MAWEEEIPKPNLRWFGNQDPRASKALQTVGVAFKDQEALAHKVQNVLQGEHINVNNEVSRTKDGIKEQINQAVLQESKIAPLKETVAAELVAANAEKTRWVNKRRHGHRKGASSLQKFLHNFSGFLEAFSGIVEVVRSAGAQYGEAGYGALSLLLIVAVRKTQNDEKIADALADLNQSFPRLDLMTEIYPEESVEILVAEAYKEVIAFAREAAEYYSQSSGGRILTAIVRPPRLGVDIAIKRTHKQLAQVNAETSSLLHRNIKTIEQDVKNLRIELRNLHKEAIEKEEREDQQRLLEFQGVLRVPEQSDHTDVRTCKTFLNDAFSPTASSTTSPRVLQRLSRYTRMTAELLFAEDDYKSWDHCQASSCLLLSGKSPPEAQAGNSAYCWLSQGAILVVERLRNEGKRVAYYCCHPQLHTTETNIQTVICHLLYQLISWSPELLRTKLQLFKTFVQRDRWQQADEKQALGAMFQALREILDHLMKHLEPNEIIYVVVDRADQCKCRHKRLIEEFVCLARSSVPIVKILIVVDSTSWKINSFACKEISEGSKGVLLCKLDWDQLRHL